LRTVKFILFYFVKKYIKIIFFIFKKVFLSSDPKKIKTKKNQNLKKRCAVPNGK